MKAYASLWSADLLALGEAVGVVDALVYGYHMDIMRPRLVVWAGFYRCPAPTDQKDTGRAPYADPHRRLG